MLKLKGLTPEEIHRLGQVEGGLNTIYHAINKIYSEIHEDCPAAGNYLIDAAGAIDSAVMAVVKMYDNKHKD